MNKESRQVYDGVDLIAQEYDLSDVRTGLETWLRDHGIKAAYDSERDYTKAEVRQAFQRQGGICAEATCKGVLIDPKFNRNVAEAERTTGDHYNPYSKGGKTSQGNCRAVHQRCNSRKGAKDPIKHSKSTGRTIAEQIHNTSVVD